MRMVRRRGGGHLTRPCTRAVNFDIWPTLRIIVEQPPAGVDYALQKGRGSAYELVQRQRSEGDLVFEFEPVVKPGIASEGMC